MNRRSIYKRPDGGVSILQAVDEAVLARKRYEADHPDHIFIGEVDITELPDREFRNAWEHDGEKIVPSLPKAIELQKDKLRFARKPLLEALDAEYMRADEKGSGAAKSAVVERKQVLRDLPQACDKANTLEELKAIMLPEEK